MADKFKQGVSVVPEFAEGESPSPAKLTSIGAQLRRAADQLEKAVGDIHGDSWPYSTTTDTRLSMAWGRSAVADIGVAGAAERPLDIANLGRLIGPASNLNPQQFVRSEITEDVPIGVHEFSLRFVPEDPTAVVFTDLSLTTFVTATALEVAGDYSVLGNGRVVCFTATAGGTATYFTDPTTYAGGLTYSGATFNVLPDPNQTNSLGANLAFGAVLPNGHRSITLPTISHQQRSFTGDTAVLADEDPNFGEQLTLPKVIVDNFVAGEAIPQGFLFLKNETTGEVYVDAEYFFLSGTAIEVSLVDLQPAIDAGNRFSIISIGTDVTSSIDDLRQKHFHDHTREFGEPFVNVSGLVGMTEDPGLSGSFGPSTYPINRFPQYLHRDGYVPGQDENVNDSNAMRGDVMLGVTGRTPGDYIGSSPGDDSFRIYFGSTNASIHGEGGFFARHLVLDAGALATIRSRSSVFITENGVAGIVGVDTSVGANHLWSAEGTFAVGSAVNAIGLVGYGFDPTIHRVMSFNLLVNIAAISASGWYPPAFPEISGGVFLDSADGVPAGPHVVYTARLIDDGAGTFEIFYDPSAELAATGAGLATWRLMVWYTLY